MRYQGIITTPAVLLLCSMSAIPASSVNTDSHIGSADFFLTKEQLEEYRPLALSGDIDKAVAISAYYSMFENSEIDAEFWLRVAAERDNCHALREYVRRILHTPRLNTGERKKYWKDRESRSCQRYKETNG